MATSSSSAIPPKRNRHTFSSFPLLLLPLFLFCCFLFTRNALVPNLSVYTDLFSQTPTVPILQLSPRSTLIQENVDHLIQTNSPDSKIQHLSHHKAALPVSSKSDLGYKISSEESSVPILSTSDLDKGKLVILSDPEVKDSFHEEIAEPVSSDEENTQRISAGFGLDKKLRDNQTFLGFEKSSGELVSSATDNESVFNNSVVEKLRDCDIYKGKWVKDEDYPLYNPGSCPYVDEAFDCQNNGRPDSDYLKWRWKPDECDLPRFNATDFLVRLRSKRLMLVGDSMNRNQFESLLCLLREGVVNKSKMYEVHGYKITKGRGYYIFKIEEYNCTVEFVRSHYLVREGVRVNGQGSSSPTLSLDRIDKTASRWKRADILVFNTAHWWTHSKTSRGKNYYKEGNFIYPHFDAVEAYRRAIKTWAKWIKKNVKSKAFVFYRGYSSAHFRGGEWDSGGTCNGETKPVISGAIIDSYPQKMMIVEEVFKDSQISAVLLNVTHLTNYRKDGHPSVYGKNVTGGRKVSTRRQDCSHWCLPGVPDAWNELIYTTLVATQSN